MDIQFYCPRWGSEEIPWEDWLTRVSEAGYDGVEWSVGHHTGKREMDKVFNLSVVRRVPVIVQHFETDIRDYTRHIESYAQWFEQIRPYPFVKINSQTGKNYFSFEQNKNLLSLAADIARDYSTTIVHETHRGRFSYAAHATRPYLLLLPYLRLTLDVSHWVAVAESFLEDQEDALQTALERTDHIHARVGYPEGPQVADPRTGQGKDALERHLAWWDLVARRKQEKGEALSICPEFGPSPYMVQDPASGKPLCNQWEVNVFMMELLRKRYARY